MNAKKRYILRLTIGSVLALTLILWMALSSQAAPQQGKKPYEVKQFSINTPGKLEVKTSGGYIITEGSETNRVKVEMYVSKNGRLLTPSDTKLNDFEISITKKGSKIQAIARKKGANWKFWNRNNISISFVVHSPRQMATDLHTSGGYIEASGLEGNQQIKTSGGHLKLTDLHGTVQARTSGGQIEISDASGKIDAHTSGGQIKTHNVTGDLDLRTSGGNINIKKMSGTVKASTSGGNIFAHFSKIGKEGKLRTSGGNINIEVPQKTGLQVDLQGSFVKAQLDHFSGETDHNHVKGTVNGGGATLRAHTSGGMVRLSFY